MSFTLRVKGFAYEQKLVGFKDTDSFNEKVEENGQLLSSLVTGLVDQYNGDAECSDREVKGYLFHKDFKSVTLL